MTFVLAGGPVIPNFGQGSSCETNNGWFCTEWVRGHWGVENGLHWVLDVAFGEDDNKTHAGNGHPSCGTQPNGRRAALRSGPGQARCHRVLFVSLSNPLHGWGAAPGLRV